MSELTEIIEDLQERIDCADIGQFEDFNWGREIGVLISGSTAFSIMKQLKRLDSPAFETSIKIQDILMQVSNEYGKALKAHPETDQFDINKMALVVSEEAGEVSKAVLQYQDEGGSLDEVKEELIQTAAMCLRMLLNLNKY